MTGIRVQHTHSDVVTHETVSLRNLPGPTLRRKKASKCRKSHPLLVLSILTYLRRISPQCSSADVSIPSRTQSPAAARITQPESRKEPPPEVELEIPKTPPPIETTLAARRAKRLAILAKYSNQPTPDPSNTGTPLSGISSAVPPPPSSVSVSDNLSRINRAEPPTPLSPTPAFDRTFSSSSLFSFRLRTHQLGGNPSPHLRNPTDLLWQKMEMNRPKIQLKPRTRAGNMSLQPTTIRIKIVERTKGSAFTTTITQVTR